MLKLFDQSPPSHPQFLRKNVQTNQDFYNELIRSNYESTNPEFTNISQFQNKTSLHIYFIYHLVKAVCKSFFSQFMSGSSHILSALIFVKYRNCCQTLDVYLLFAIWMGQIQIKLIYIFVTYGLASL